jgi:hypothetical protein
MGEHGSHVSTHGLHMGAHGPHVGWKFFEFFYSLHDASRSCYDLCHDLVIFLSRFYNKILLHSHYAHIMFLF